MEFLNNLSNLKFSIKNRKLKVRKFVKLNLTIFFGNLNRLKKAMTTLITHLRSRCGLLVHVSIKLLIIRMRRIIPYCSALHHSHRGSGGGMLPVHHVPHCRIWTRVATRAWKERDECECYIPRMWSLNGEVSPLTNCQENFCSRIDKKS